MLPMEPPAPGSEYEALDPQRQDECRRVAMCRETPPARLECLLDLEHSWGTEAEQIENVSTVPTWDGRYRDALSETGRTLTRALRSMAVKVFRNLNDITKYTVFDEFLWLL